MENINMEKNSLPLCNWCNTTKQAEWEFVYGELPTHDYSYCCTEHIPDLIKHISNGKKGEVKVGYLIKWNVKYTYDEHWDDAWGKFWRKLIGLPKDNTPGFIKGLNRVLNDSK